MIKLLLNMLLNQNLTLFDIKLLKEAFSELTSTFRDEHPLKNSLMLEMQSASVLGSWQYCTHDEINI